MQQFLLLLSSLLLLAASPGQAQAKEAEEEVANIVHYQPEQVHLAFGERTASEIVVTWSTRSLPPDPEVGATSVVEYGRMVAGQARFTQHARGTATKFVDGGRKQATQYIHRVTLSGLEANATYMYHCGSAVGWSAIFQFRTVPTASADWSPSVAIYGDMGNENAQSLARLQQETQRGMYDAIIHVGDFAYDMNTENARVGDEFMRQIETVAAYLPYMVVPGNHEEKFNFSNYRARFSMPGGTENMFYSFDLGPVHFVGISTEVYYFLNYGVKTLVFQFEWLRKDLEKANLPENRKERPWIILYGHRPMYCSNENDNDCTHSETLTRVGWPFVHMFGLEPLLYEFGVDVAIWAHEHSYERLWPIYDYEVRNGTLKDSPYEDPRAPVHIVTGSAGCKEGREPFKGKIPEWSAFHSQDYGYTRLKAHNRTHLHFEQVSDDQDGAVIDEFWLVKSRHGSYEANNFSHYINRFSMPGGSENMFYSFDIGPVHFIGFSTEFYYFTQFGLKQIVMQYDWLERDLVEANKPENRRKRPWIITYGHRPMYCSNDNGDDCANHETIVRKGLPMLDIFGLEPLFYQYGVDVELWAHEHCYERMWPMYNYTVYNGSLAEPYRNPGAPIHIISGAAGNHEGREPFFKQMPPWSAFHSQDFGYLRLKAHNASHLYFEQVSDDKKGEVIDSFWVIKDKHGPYA